MLPNDRDSLLPSPAARPAYGYPYVFGPFEIDPQNGSLRRDGAEVHLRRKTFQVLVYLIEQRHRTVSKQELWDQLWSGCAVTDDALVQCVKDIRRALQDDPRTPIYVRTVPRLGYRFIGEVSELQPAPPAPLVFPRPVESRPAPVAEPSVAPRRHRAMRYVGIAAALVAVAAAAILTLRGLRGSAVSADPGKTSILVAYLDNDSGALELDWLRQGLADMLISGLSRSDRLALVGRRQFDLALTREFGARIPSMKLDLARRLAVDLHADKVLLGTFGRLGTRLRVDVQLYDTASGAMLGSERLVADRQEDMLSEVDLLSLRLAARLGTPRPAGRLVDVMTDNLEAYRCYSIGVEKAYALDTNEAVAMFERAIALDPQFAMAHARIGYTYGVTGAQPELAKPYLEKAFRLSERLTARDRLNISAWYTLVSYDFPQAIRHYRQIVAAFPEDVEAYYRLSTLLRGEERYDEALSVLTQALSIDPHSPDVYNSLSGLHFELGKYEAMVDYAQRYVDASHGDANAYDTLGLAHTATGAYEQARRAFEQALTVRPGFDVALIHLANTYAREGKYAAADREFARYLSLTASVGQLNRAWNSRAFLARMSQRFDKAAEYTAKLKPDTYGTPSLEVVLLALARGDRRPLDAAWARGEREGRNRGQRPTRRFAWYTRGVLLLKSGRGDEALKAFAEALKHPAPIYNVEDYETALADAYLELGRYDEAIAEYDRVVRVIPTYGLAWFGLAEAQYRSGRRAEGLKTYQTFLRVWSAADRDLPWIRTAQERVQTIAAAR
jgi:tetratricopeptide (TPR) repeat protein/DNA-binding winged helix-turn-helix (wHTH) protein